MSSSLSDLTNSAAKSGKTPRFSLYFCANRITIRLKSVKNCARLPLFSLRPIKSDRLVAGDGRVSALTHQAKGAWLFPYKEVREAELLSLDDVESVKASKCLAVAIAPEEVQRACWC